MAILCLALTLPCFGGENLRLNPTLHYDSDNHDGPLITGNDLDAAAVAGKPAYVIIYGDGSTTRSARRGGW